MQRHSPVLTFLLKGIYFGALVGAGVGAWLIKLALETGPCAYPSWVCLSAEVVRDRSWVVVVCPAAAAASKFGLEQLEKRWVHSMIQVLLTEYRKTLFGAFGGPTDGHRATLFVHRKFAFWRTWPWGRARLPWSGWLVPISRSDHTNQSVRARFLAPDDSRHSEGIAGQAWRYRSVVTVQSLPELTTASSASEIAEYCRLTSVSASWVQKRLKGGDPLPRSLRGLPIEVQSEICGVVVLDSCEKEAFTQDKHGSANFTLLFSSTVSRLIERARP